MLDGENMRLGISKDLGFTADDRSENLRRSAEVAKLLNDAGLICVCAFVAPREEVRNKAANVVGNERFLTVHWQLRSKSVEPETRKAFTVPRMKVTSPIFRVCLSRMKCPSNPICCWKPISFHRQNAFTHSPVAQGTQVSHVGRSAGAASSLAIVVPPRSHGEVLRLGCYPPLGPWSRHNFEIGMVPCQLVWHEPSFSVRDGGDSDFIFPSERRRRQRSDWKNPRERFVVSRNTLYVEPCDNCDRSFGTASVCSLPAYAFVRNAGYDVVHRFTCIGQALQQVGKSRGFQQLATSLGQLLPSVPHGLRESLSAGISDRGLRRASWRFNRRDDLPKD